MWDWAVEIRCFRARWSVDVLGLDADQGLICGWCAAVRRLIASWDIMIVTLYTDYTQNTWCCFPRFVQHGLSNTLGPQISATVRLGLVSDCDASVVVFVLPSCSPWHPLSSFCCSLLVLVLLSFRVALWVFDTTACRLGNHNCFLHIILFYLFSCCFISDL